MAEGGDSSVGALWAACSVNMAVLVSKSLLPAHEERVLREHTGFSAALHPSPMPGMPTRYQESRAELGTPKLGIRVVQASI